MFIASGGAPIFCCSADARTIGPKPAELHSPIQIRARHSRSRFIRFLPTSIFGVALSIPQERLKSRRRAGIGLADHVEQIDLRYRLGMGDLHGRDDVHSAADVGLFESKIL